MRSISQNGLNTLAKRLGNEPITIIEIDWIPGKTYSYADRDVQMIPGRLVEVGALDNVVDCNANNKSQSISITIDDTDGTIKTIFDAHDVHKRDARVYQWFEGLALTDKFLLFSGKINTPVSWNEHDRTIKATILSQIEDQEAGFSAEIGQFPFVPAAVVGKAWPMIFGLVTDYPALRLTTAIQGATLAGVGIVTGGDANYPLYSDGSNTDSGNAASLAVAAEQASVLFIASELWAGIDAMKSQQFLDQANAIQHSMASSVAKRDAKEACLVAKRQQQQANLKKGLGVNPLPILGGEDFPQDKTITLNINGGLFTGYFHGDENAPIYDPNQPQYDGQGNFTGYKIVGYGPGADFYITSRDDPKGDLQYAENLAAQQQGCNGAGSGGGGSDFSFTAEVPCGMGDMGDPCHITHKGWVYTTTGGNAYATPNSLAVQFWADAGAKVLLASAEPQTYIASITPGTVLAVKAFQTLSGVRRLTLVPNNLYTVSTVDYGAVKATIITLTNPLSTIADQGWDDEIYVTFQSTIGPNIVDIMKYLIANYTNDYGTEDSLTWNDASFNHVREKLIPFPANFPVLDQKNTLDLLTEIAFQARCAIWLDNGVFYIKYLPEEPESVGEISVSDIDSEQGVEVELTPTENIVTKMRIKWHLTWAPDPDFVNKDAERGEQWIILRHNVAKYGLQSKDFEWYIFSQPDIILKCATFWLIRLSNTWKRVKFRTFLNKLNFETFDCVTFNVPGHAASGPVKAIVQTASYNSADNVIDFECETPVLMGTLEKSKFYWPSELGIGDTWPPKTDIETGNAGGGSIGTGATGKLPIGFTDGIGGSGTVFVGGPNVVFRSQSDWGDRTPTDAGFVAQTIAARGSYARVWASSKPVLHLDPQYLQPSAPIPLPPMPTGLVIDLATTKVMDSSKDDKRIGRLKSLLTIDENSNVAIDLSAAQCFQDDTSGPLNSLLAVTTDGDVALNLDSAGILENDTTGLLSDVLTVSDSGKGGIKDNAIIVSADNEAAFDFKYDTESQRFGAGTAFLKD